MKRTIGRASSKRQINDVNSKRSLSSFAVKREEQGSARHEEDKQRPLGCASKSGLGFCEKFAASIRIVSSC
jgi:hypothetical protein